MKVKIAQVKQNAKVTRHEQTMGTKIKREKEREWIFTLTTLIGSEHGSTKINKDFYV